MAEDVEQTPRWKRRAFLAGGMVSVGLAAIGLVLPLMPCTCFVLLGLTCFARSSARWHHWLWHHPAFSPYVRAFLEGRGLTHGQKARIGLVLTASLAVSAWFSPVLAGRILAGVVWVATVVVLVRCRTAVEPLPDGVTGR